MNPVALALGIVLLVGGVVVAVASIVTLLDAVAERTRRGATRTESAFVWHGAMVAHLPRALVGAALAVLGAALLGWFSR